jgi:hypothetical protein
MDIVVAEKGLPGTESNEVHRKCTFGDLTPWIPQTLPCVFGPK